MAHPYLKARTKQKWIESAKHLRIPPHQRCGLAALAVGVSTSDNASVFSTTHDF